MGDLGEDAPAFFHLQVVRTLHEPAPFSQASRPATSRTDPQRRPVQPEFVFRHQRPSQAGSSRTVAHRDIRVVICRAGRRMSSACGASGDSLAAVSRRLSGSYSSMLTMGQLTTTPIGPHGFPSGPDICPARPSLATVPKSICRMEFFTGIGVCVHTDA
jgi:hypothetical protein